MLRANSNRVIHTFFILCMGLILFTFSCKKEEIDEITDEYIEVSELMNISISGTVENEIGDPLEGVFISIDDYTVVSNDKGIYSFHEVSVHGPRMRIQFTHNDFHSVFKSIEIEENGRFHQNAVMISLGEPINFSASSPAQVKLDNVIIDFEANSFIDDSGNEYSGAVNVYTQFFDPTSTEFASSFPSSLEVLDDKNEIGFMHPFSGLSVVLTGDSGQKLEINKNAKVKLKVPNELLSSAPTSLLMGHYNEDLRIWEEQTTAVLVDGFYETNLNHFSSWCCYVNFAHTYLSGFTLKEIIDSLFAEPLPDVYVEVRIEGTSITGSTRSSGNGSFHMKVPKNVNLEVSMYANSFDKSCDEPIYVENIPPLSNYYDLGNLTLGSPDLIIVSGTAVDCNQNTLNGGFVFLENGAGDFLAHPIESNGSFTIPIYSCSDVFSLVVYDNEFNYSSEKLVNLSSDTDVLLGVVIACEILVTPPYFMKVVTEGDTIISSANNGTFDYNADVNGNLASLTFLYFKADIVNTSRPLNEGSCTSLITLNGLEEQACEITSVEIFIPLKDAVSEAGYLFRSWPGSPTFPNTWSVSYNCVEGAEYLHIYGRALLEVGGIGQIVTHRNPEVFYDIYYPL